MFNDFNTLKYFLNEKYIGILFYFFYFVFFKNKYLLIIFKTGSLVRGCSLGSVQGRQGSGVGPSGAYHGDRYKRSCVLA